MTAEVRLELVSDPETLQDEWTELAKQGGNIFSSWEWASTWLLHRGQDKSLLVFASHDAEKVELILPLYLWLRRPLRIARFLGHGPADQLGPIVAADYEARSAPALKRAAEEADLDLVLAELLPAEDGLGARLGAATLLRESSPSASLEGGWTAYLDRHSANFRQQVRRRERNLGRRYSLRYRFTADPATLETDLTLLFSLHRARWGSGSAFERWEAFHRDFAAIALARGWLRLWFLELDGRPVAAWYGFRFGRTESYYQSGRDPACNDGSVGFVLLAHTIREAANDGMREYRFLRGSELYKQRFADRDDGLETIAIARGISGRVGRVAVAAGIRSAPISTAFRQLTERR